jgi:hypothetical protein
MCNREFDLVHLRPAASTKTRLTRERTERCLTFLSALRDDSARDASTTATVGGSSRRAPLRLTGCAARAPVGKRSAVKKLTVRERSGGTGIRRSAFIDVYRYALSGGVHV